MAITLATGEALTGDGNELAHIDLLIGSKSGPVGAAFAMIGSGPDGLPNELLIVAAGRGYPPINVPEGATLLT